MKTTFQKLLCGLFAFIMVFLLAGCGNKPEQPNPSGNDTNPAATSAGTQEDGETPVSDSGMDDVGSITFPDRTVNFLVRGFPTYENELFADSDSIATVDYEVYRRQIDIEKRLDILIEYTKTAKSSAHGDIDELRNIVLGGNTDQFDVYAGSGYRSCPASLEGLFVAFDDVPYVNTDKSYWADYYIEEANITDKTYVITGSLATTTVQLMACTFFNIYLINTLDLENPYTLVEDHNWTLAKLAEISTQVYSDKNGDDTRNEGDLYGLSYSCINGITVDAFTSSCDLRLVGKDDKGKLELTVDKAKVQNVTEQLNKLMWASTTWSDGNLKGADQGDCVNFSRDLRVFLLGAIYLTGYSSFIDMEHDYGILPYPMYDSEQDQYYSYVEDQVTVFSVVKHSQNTDMIGAVLEAMASYSYKKVMPVYYDIMLKGRYFKEPQSAEIIDMMAENIRVDIAWCYNSRINYLASLMRTLVEGKIPYFSTTYEASIGVFQGYIDNLIPDEVEAEA